MIQSSAFACSCGWNGGLVKNAQRNSLTVHGKVNRFLSFKEIRGDSIATSMEIEILSKLKGNESRNLITIWGDRGADCRPYLSGIRIGSEWILSLHEIGNNEYAVSICGEHITAVKENRTSGYLLYNDRCSVEKPLVMSVDSVKLAIENYSKFVFPTKSCKEGESKYFTEVNQPPKISKEKSVPDFLKEKMNISRDIRKKHNEQLSLVIFFDETGNVERVSHLNNWGNSKKMRRKYGDKIVNLLKGESPWVPAKHRGENLPMKLVLHIRLEDLILE